MPITPGRAGRAPRSGDAKSPAQIVQELWDLVRAYARQETLDPLRNLGRFLGWGIVGSVFMTFGVLMLSLALLRFLQRFDWLQERAWVSYAIELAFLLVVLVLFSWRAAAAWRRVQGPSATTPPTPPATGGGPEAPTPAAGPRTTETAEAAT